MNEPENEHASVRPGSRREAADRRIRLIALIASTLIHGGLIVAYSFTVHDWSAIFGRVSVEVPAAPAMDGTQLVNIIEIEPPDPSREGGVDAELSEEDEEILPTLLRGVIVTGDVPDGPLVVFRAAIPAASVFRIRITDPSLWMVARPDLLLLTPEERMQLELMGRLEAWNDSLIAVIAAEAALLDWTKSDGKGGKWGISRGKLHLGSLTIPLPFGFGPNPWQAEQIAARRRREDDILNHVQAQVVRASWKERAEAIRRRKDRERERARARRGGADTTRSRRGGG